MKKILQNLILGLGFTVFVAAPVAVIATPQPVFAGAACEQRFLGIPPWFRGLTDDECNISAPDAGEDGLSSFIWAIVLNVIEIALVIVGYIALFFIMYGGFLYLTGGGNAATTENAKKTILNAVIGLAIALSAIAITNIIFGILG